MVDDPNMTSRPDITRWFPLTDHAVIHVTGPDAGAFLQGQLTCDVQSLAPGQHSLAAWLSAEGRVRTVLRLARLTDRFLIILPTDLSDSTRQGLARFVIRKKVSLEADPRTGVWGLAGPGAATALENAGYPAPDAGGVESSDSVITLATNESPVRYLLMASTGDPGATLHAANPALTEGDTNDWALGDIRAGVPRVQLETAEHFLATQLNLDLLGAVSFTKGCYPGQEIVARMHYRGRIKHRMREIVGPPDLPTSPGASIKDALGREGWIVQAHRAGDVVHASVIMPLDEIPDR